MHNIIEVIKTVDVYFTEYKLNAKDQLLMRSALERWLIELNGLSLSREEEKRPKERMDYGRAQPTPNDWEMVCSFLEEEVLEEDQKHYGRRSQLARKLGLFIAAQFNRGFEAGVKKVRDENGYKSGYNEALEEFRTAVTKIPPKE